MKVLVAASLAALIAALSHTAAAQEEVIPVAEEAPAPAPVAPPPPPMPTPVKIAAKESPMVGTWNWVSTKDQCTETHQYQPNGVKITNSGEDVSEDYYTVFKLADKLYKVSGMVSKDNGKPDCMGGLTALNAQSSTYVRFNDDGSIRTCSNYYDEASCYGNATRATPAVADTKK